MEKSSSTSCIESYTRERKNGGTPLIIKITNAEEIDPEPEEMILDHCMEWVTIHNPAGVYDPSIAKTVERYCKRQPERNDEWFCWIHNPNRKGPEDWNMSLVYKCLSCEKSISRNKICEECKIGKFAPSGRDEVIYIIGSSTDNHIKIGLTCGNVNHRIGHLQNGNPHRLKVLWTSPPTYFARKIEHLVHRDLKIYRVVGEWFKDISVTEARNSINRVMASDPRFLRT